MIKVIEASNDQELALKVTEAINAGTLPYGDWEYRDGRFIVLTTDGTPDGPGGFQLVWGISSGHISAVAEPLIQQGWLAFGAVKVANGQYVQALTLGVPANSGGGIKEVYAADIVDSTQLGGTDVGIDLFTAVDVNAAHDALLAGVFGLDMYHAADQGAAHTLLGAGEAGLAVYRGATKEAIKTYLDIGGGSVTVDSIPDVVLDAWQDVLFVQFRHKGDEQGEIHFGVVAQQVKQIFENHNLDPFAYGLLCYEEWDAVPEYRDEVTGEVFTPAREAGNRYGVRYQECMILEAALTRRTIQRMQSGA